MIISHPRWASVLVRDARGGEVEAVAFDDIGDMLDYRHDRDSDKVIKACGHDSLSQEWLGAAGADDVFGGELDTRMGHGLAPLARPEDAEQLAGEVSGHVLDWEGVLAATTASWASGPSPPRGGDTLVLGS